MDENDYFNWYNPRKMVYPEHFHIPKFNNQNIFPISLEHGIETCLGIDLNICPNLLRKFCLIGSDIHKADVSIELSDFIRILIRLNNQVCSVSDLAKIAILYYHGFNIQCGFNFPLHFQLYDFSQETETENTKNVLKQLTLERWKYHRDRIIEITFGLQSLELPALITLLIVDAEDPRMVSFKMLLKWDTITKIKHFKDKI